MSQSDFTHVDSSRLRDCVEGIFRWKDLPEDDARIVAETLVEADLRGVHSHGVLRVDTYVGQLDEGLIVPRPDIRVVADLGSRVVMDGGAGMGQVSGHRAMELAIQRATEHGIASVSLRNGRHIGATAYYSMMASAQDLIGITVTNAGINMAPTGGKNNLVGNNPLGIAVPTNQAFPMILDMATSVAAGGKLDVAISKGQEIPFGWALGPDGRPTSDPKAARKGTLLPVGGHKGYGLAVMLDILAGVLSGGRFGADLGLPGFSQLFMSIKVEGLMPIGEFKARIDELVDQLHGAEPIDSGARVYIPGEIEWELSQERLKNGVPLPSSVLNKIEGHAGAAGLKSKPSKW